MGVDMTTWLGSSTESSNTLRAQRWAARAWQRIQRKPSSVALKRAGTTLAAQTVRIDVDSSASEATDASGRGAVRKLTILGLRGHATLANTNIRKGDRVVIDGAEYVVMSVNTQILGEIQAQAEAVS